MGSGGKAVTTTLALWAATVLAGLAGVACGPGAATALEVLISREAFNQEQHRPTEPLSGEGETSLGAEIRRVPGVARLRVEPAQPERPVVFRFREQEDGTLTLTVILVTREGHFEYQYREGSQELRGDRLVTPPGFRQGEAAETDLSGEPGQVATIRVQDDSTAELRLKVEGETLVLRALTTEQGGNPSGGRVPPYLGKPLRFLDYTVLAAGYTDNFLLETVFLKDFAVMLNYFSASGTTATLVRGVVRQQTARWERVALWLEGGAGYYTVSPADSTDTNADSPDWQFGVSTEYRYGDWGAAAALSTTNGTTLAMVMGGWQFSSTFGALLHWQSFQGLAAYGLGMTLVF